MYRYSYYPCYPDKTHFVETPRPISKTLVKWQGHDPSLDSQPRTLPGIVHRVYAVLCTTHVSLHQHFESKKGGTEGSKWWREVKRSGRRDRWDRGLLHRYSESVSGTSEVENICFVLKSALGLSHDETQPGAQQHSRILPLVSPLPPLPLANQEPAYPEETLHQPCNLSCRYAAFISYGNCLLNIFM